LKLALLLAALAVAGGIGALLGKQHLRNFVGGFAESLVLSRLPELDESTRRRLPNVILISVDTLRKSEVGLYDPSLPTTPHLNERKNEFIRFDQAICQAPWTGPSHLAFFYSRRPPVNFWEWDVISLPQVLRHYGYATAAFTDGGWLGAGSGIDTGFDHLSSPNKAGGMVVPLKEKTEQITGWLDGDRGNPFFLFIHTYNTHLPYDPEPGQLAATYHGNYSGSFTGAILPLLQLNQERLTGNTPEVAASDIEYLRALYRAEIREVDEFLDQLFAALEERGAWDDTLVIVTSDHGESFFERGFFDHGTGLYDELINVPLLMKLPAAVPARTHAVARQVELLDLAPTILDLIGIAPPAGFEGESFVSLFSDAARIAYEKPYALSVVGETKNYGDAKQSVRTEEWKYIVHPSSGREELYRLTTDPGERQNLVERYPEIAASLRDHLQDPSKIENLESPSAPRVGEEDREILRALGYIE